MDKKKYRRILLSLFIFSFIIVVAVSIYANTFIAFSIKTMEYNINQRMITASIWLSELVTLEELDKYQTVEDMELPEYQALRKKLLDFSQKNNVLYAYYIRPLGNDLQYIIDNDFNEETRVGLDTEPFNLSDYSEMLSVVEGNITYSKLGDYAVGWEGLITAYAPMFDNNGKVAAIAGVDLDDAEIVLARDMVTFLMIVQIIAVIVVFITGLITLILYRKQAILVTEANEKLKALATTDELTKLDNRRSFMEYLNIVWKQNTRLNLPVTVLMIDIDYFKKYNDSLGHLEGDKALIAIAQCMKQQLKREADFIARFGGEEFVCLLPFYEKEKAHLFAEKLVKSVEDLQLPHPQSDLSDYITISIGVATAPDNTISQAEFLEEADKALYKAKQTGRNRVVCA